MNEIKVCSKCKIKKDKSKFYKRNTRKSGVQSECIKCFNKRLENKNYLAINIGNKTCSKCKEIKDINFFYKTKYSKDGRCTECKSCQIKYKKERYKNDINFRLKECCRIRIIDVIRGRNKSASTQKLIGCSIDELKKHLESKFTEGMNWENYGDWHVDHIIPCASFDFSKEDEQKKCFHYTNLQPLWAKDNLRKGDKIND